MTRREYERLVDYALSLSFTENDGQILDLSTESQNDTGDIDLPQTNAYAEEIRYFKDCVNEGRFPDKVKPEELKQVLHILNTL